MCASNPLTPLINKLPSWVDLGDVGKKSNQAVDNAINTVTSGPPEVAPSTNDTPQEKPIAAPAAATMADPTIGETEEARRKRLEALRRGLATTVKTGAGGVQGPAPVLTAAATAGGKAKLGQ